MLGCSFALDDFGSGFSSFGYLRDLPVDFLKIDGSFVRGIDSDLTARSIVQGITEIGHASGMRIIAEHVEDAHIFESLCTMGVDFAQGFGLSRPEPFIREALDAGPPSAPA
jgi:EAL domain-containing protein (putative c-di-GMP-specific phosphodiesterase class I)